MFFKDLQPLSVIEERGCNQEVAITDRKHAEYGKLYKVRWLGDHLKKPFQPGSSPAEDISVDECMIPFI